MLKKVGKPPADLKLKVETWAIEKVFNYARNARLHSEEQVAAIAASIKEFGFINPCLVDQEGMLIAGHGRVLACKLLGLTKVPVIRLEHLDENQIKALRIADNALPSLASWSPDLLRVELNDLALAGYEMSLLGFSDVQLVSFLATPSDEDNPEEKIPPTSGPVVTRKGDMWILKDHRVICGDCRDDETVGRLFDGEKINLAFTSPPYAEQRDYDESSGFKPIPPDKYVEWFAPVAALVAKHLAPDGSWFVNIKPSAEGLNTSLYVMDLVIAHVRKWGWHFATEFCWERVGVPKSVTRRFKNQFEPIYQFARNDWKMRAEAVRHPSDDVPIPGGPGTGQTSRKSAQGGNGAMFGAQKGRFNARPPGASSGSPLDEHRQGKTKWTNSNKRKNGSAQAQAQAQGTNWQPGEYIAAGMAYPGNRLPSFTSSHEALGHAAAFPVGLPEFFCKAYTDPRDRVYDPFCGSGSTIIAAHKTDRIGYGAEISPQYCDTIVRRWQTFANADAVLAGDGRTYAEIAKARKAPSKRPARPVGAAKKKGKANPAIPA